MSSGGTIAGLSLGSFLSNLKAKVGLIRQTFSFMLGLPKSTWWFKVTALQVHAFSVCDDPNYFYGFTQGLLDGLEAGISSRDIVNIQNVCPFILAMNVSCVSHWLCFVATKGFLIVGIMHIYVLNFNFKLKHFERYFWPQYNHCKCF